MNRIELSLFSFKDWYGSSMSGAAIARRADGKEAILRRYKVLCCTERESCVRCLEVEQFDLK
jgi:hypothetical protein